MCRFTTVPACVTVLMLLFLRDGSLQVHAAGTPYLRDAMKLMGMPITATTCHSTDVERQLEGAGFHQTVNYHVNLQSISEQMKCNLSQVALVQPLPVEIFADPYQLSQLESVSGLGFTVHGDVDLESPASVCPPTTLSVRLSPAQMSQPQVQLRVPLHARYPAVLDKADSGVLDSDVSKSWYSELLSGVEAVKFPPATLLVECKSQQHEHQGGDDRQWHVLESVAQVELVWLVPAGLQKHAEDVNLGTMVTVMVATVVLLTALFSRDMK